MYIYLHTNMLESFYDCMYLNIYFIFVYIYPTIASTIPTFPYVCTGGQTYTSVGGALSSASQIDHLMRYLNDERAQRQRSDDSHLDETRTSSSVDSAMVPSFYHVIFQPASSMFERYNFVHTKTQMHTVAIG